MGSARGREIPKTPHGFGIRTTSDRALANIRLIVLWPTSVVAMTDRWTSGIHQIANHHRFD